MDNNNRNEKFCKCSNNNIDQSKIIIETSKQKNIYDQVYRKSHPCPHCNNIVCHGHRKFCIKCKDAYCSHCGREINTLNQINSGLCVSELLKQTLFVCVECDDGIEYEFICYYLQKRKKKKKKD